MKPKRSIFDFYRTGKLQRPHDIPINVFIREVQFYEIQNEIIPEEYLKLPQSKIKGNRVVHGLYLKISIFSIFPYLRNAKHAILTWS